jgi:hypothetical protein
VVTFKKQQVINFIIALLSLVLLFHFSILTQLIPFKIVWGGKLNSQKQMIGFETISIIVNLFIVLIVCLKGQHIRNSISEKVINAFLWVFFIIFSLNTFGNMFAESFVEKIVFTPLTLLLAICFWLILKDKKN